MKKSNKRTAEDLIEAAGTMPFGKFNYYLNLCKDRTCIQCQNLVTEVSNKKATLADCKEDKDFGEFFYKKSVCSKFLKIE